MPTVADILNEIVTKILAGEPFSSGMNLETDVISCRSSSFSSEAPIALEEYLQQNGPFAEEEIFPREVRSFDEDDVESDLRLNSITKSIWTMNKRRERLLSLLNELQEVTTDLSNIVAEKGTATVSLGLESFFTPEDLRALHQVRLHQTTPIIVAGESGICRCKIVNGILGRDILPWVESVYEEIIFRVRYGERTELQIVREYGQEDEPISFSDEDSLASLLSNFCEGTSSSFFSGPHTWASSRLLNASIRFVDIFYPLQVLRGGLIVVVAPGLALEERSRRNACVLQMMRDAGAILYVVDDFRPSAFESTVRTLRRIPDSQNTFILVSNMHHNVDSGGVPLTTDLLSPSSFFTPSTKKMQTRLPTKETLKNTGRRSLDDTIFGVRSPIVNDALTENSGSTWLMNDAGMEWLEDVSASSNFENSAPPGKRRPVSQPLDADVEASRLTFASSLDEKHSPPNAGVTADDIGEPVAAANLLTPSKHWLFELSPQRLFRGAGATLNKNSASPFSSPHHGEGQQQHPQQHPQHVKSHVNSTVRQFYYKVVRRVFPDWESKAIRCPRFHYYDVYDEEEVILGLNLNKDRIAHLRESVARVLETTSAERLRLDGDFLVSGIQNCKDYFLTQSEIIEFGASISAQSQAQLVKELRQQLKLDQKSIASTIEQIVIQHREGWLIGAAHLQPVSAADRDQDLLEQCRDAVSSFLETELQKVLYSHLKLVLDETCWRIRGAIQHKLQQLKLGQGTVHSSYFTTALADIFGENGENVHVRFMKKNGFWGSALFKMNDFFRNFFTSSKSPGTTPSPPPDPTLLDSAVGPLTPPSSMRASASTPGAPPSSVIAACSSFGPASSLLVSLAEQCLSSIDFNIIAEGLLSGPRMGLVQMEKILSDKVAVCRNLHIQAKVLSNVATELEAFAPRVDRLEMETTAFVASLSKPPLVLLQRRGQGAAACTSTYVGQFKGHKEMVFVKRVKKEVEDIDPHVFSEFVHLRRLRGFAHVVQVLGVVANDEEFFLVSELMHRDLREAINSKSLSLCQKVRIARLVTEGLAAIHDSGLLYLDLKPANILLRHGADEVKITDFGSAFPAALASTRGVDAGTPEFSAPEVGMQGELVTAAADVFSLGVLIHVLWTEHEDPYAHVQVSHRQQLQQLVREGTRPIITAEMMSEVPGLVHIIEGCWQGDPARRWNLLRVRDSLVDLETKLASTGCRRIKRAKEKKLEVGMKWWLLLGRLRLASAKAEWKGKKQAAIRKRALRPMVGLFKRGVLGSEWVRFRALKTGATVKCAVTLLHELKTHCKRLDVLWSKFIRPLRERVGPELLEVVGGREIMNFFDSVASILDSYVCLQRAISRQLVPFLSSSRGPLHSLPRSSTRISLSTPMDVTRLDISALNEASSKELGGPGPTPQRSDSARRRLELGDVLFEFATSGFLNSSQFLANFKLCVRLLNGFRISRPDFSQFLDAAESEEMEGLGGFSFLELLNEPLLQIPRLLRSIHDLRKHSWGRDLRLLDCAGNALWGHVKEMPELAKARAVWSVYVRLQSSLLEIEYLPMLHRRYVSEYSFQLLDHGRLFPVVLFLLSDSLTVAKIPDSNNPCKLGNSKHNRAALRAVGNPSHWFPQFELLASVDLGKVVLWAPRCHPMEVSLVTPVRRFVFSLCSAEQRSAFVEEFTKAKEKVELTESERWVDWSASSASTAALERKRVAATSPSSKGSDKSVPKGRLPQLELLDLFDFSVF